MIQEGEEEGRGPLAYISSWLHFAASRLVRAALKKPSLAVPSVAVAQVGVELLFLSPAIAYLPQSRQEEEEVEGEGQGYLEAEASLLSLSSLPVSALQHHLW